MVACFFLAGLPLGVVLLLLLLLTLWLPTPKDDNNECSRVKELGNRTCKDRRTRLSFLPPCGVPMPRSGLLLLILPLVMLLLAVVLLRTVLPGEFCMSILVVVLVGVVVVVSAVCNGAMSGKPLEWGEERGEGGRGDSICFVLLPLPLLLSSVCVCVCGTVTVGLCVCV